MTRFIPALVLVVGLVSSCAQGNSAARAVTTDLLRSDLLTYEDLSDLESSFERIAETPAPLYAIQGAYDAGTIELHLCNESILESDNLRRLEAAMGVSFVSTRGPWGVNEVVFGDTENDLVGAFREVKQQIVECAGNPGRWADLEDAAWSVGVLPIPTGMDDHIALQYAAGGEHDEVVHRLVVVRVGPRLAIVEEFAWTVATEPPIMTQAEFADLIESAVARLER